MIFNLEGLLYAMEKHTMWTYRREMVLESMSSRQQESALTTTAGVEKKSQTRLRLFTVSGGGGGGGGGEGRGK